MILRKPIYLVIVLSLVFTILAIPEPALAVDTYCPAGSSLVAKYNWNQETGTFVVDTDSPADVITFLPWSVDPLIPYDSHKGRWESTVSIDIVIIADGKVDQVDVTATYFYDSVFSGYYDMADTGYGYKDISNIIFCSDGYLVSVASLAAQANRGLVNVDWVTASEVNNAGFVVYRSASASGPLEQVSAKLIAAKGDGVTGASYRYTDVPGYGIFYYWLEDVDYSGMRSLHGPVVVKVLPPIRQPLYRPSLPGQD